MNIEEIGNQLKDALDTDIAIIDKYGFILYSNLTEFTKGSLISHQILDFINAKTEVSKDLKVKEIDSIIINSGQFRYIFTFGKELILMSKIVDKIDLNQFLPSVKRLISMLDMKKEINDEQKFTNIDLNNIIQLIEERNKKLEKQKSEKFSVFKDIIKQISSF